MKLHVLTLFPQAFPGSLNISIIGKALNKGLVDLQIHDLKQFSINGMIDDTPYGGGSGMVIKPEIIHNAIITLNLANSFKIFLSPRGAIFNQAIAQAICQIPYEIVILCGRYEGIDQRVLDYWNFHELSLGGFVLCGGEVAALAIIEACIRLIPGVMGNKASGHDESFENGLLEYNQYTKPEKWSVNDETLGVPEVLLSGNHQEINAFRIAESLTITLEAKKNRCDE